MTRLTIVGAGIAGVASAYHLARAGDVRDVVLVDARAPLGLTTAASGENYRTWWPQPALSALVARSLELIEEIARRTDNRAHLTRLGYVYATRESDVDAFAKRQLAAYPHLRDAIRLHASPGNDYAFDPSTRWDATPDGIDVVTDPATIRRHFPDWDEAVTGFVHVRRAGDLSAQQLGDHLLGAARARGLVREQGEVMAIEPLPAGHAVVLADGRRIESEQVLLAAGPFLAALAEKAGVELPLYSVYQQKIAFEDRAGAIARTTPFTIDLDPQSIDWSDDEREALAGSEELAWLAEPMPGGIHRRPDGGPDGTWVKLGWAYNRARTTPQWDPSPDAHFREVVLRGAARLHPSLRAYYGRLPRALSHYGGHYTRTAAHLPLIGPTTREGLYVIGALSGYGTMACCAAGELAAAWIGGHDLPDHARVFSPSRYQDDRLMSELRAAPDGEL